MELAPALQGAILVRLLRLVFPVILLVLNVQGLVLMRVLYVKDL